MFWILALALNLTSAYALEGMPDLYQEIAVCKVVNAGTEVKVLGNTYAMMAQKLAPVNDGLLVISGVPSPNGRLMTIAFGTDLKFIGDDKGVTFLEPYSGAEITLKNGEAIDTVYAGGTMTCTSNFGW